MFPGTTDTPQDGDTLPRPLQGSARGRGTAAAAALPRLRHTFGTLAVRKGRGAGVQSWMGHANIRQRCGTSTTATAATKPGCSPRPSASNTGRLELDDPRLDRLGPEPAIAAEPDVRNRARARLGPHPVLAHAEPVGDVLGSQQGRHRSSPKIVIAMPAGKRRADASTRASGGVDPHRLRLAPCQRRRESPPGVRAMRIDRRKLLRLRSSSAM